MSIPLLPFHERPVRAMADVEVQTGLGFVIIGAFARDIQLARSGASPSGRETTDSDVAVAVTDWGQMNQIAEVLREHGYEPDPRQRQRWLGPERSILDVIPFGGVSQDGSITWPPDHEVEMSVLGFREAFETADLVRLGDDLKVRVASFPAMIALKAISWAERPYSRMKDALDLSVLLQSYHEAVEERLFDEHDDLLNADPFDIGQIGARIAGRDIARAFGPGDALGRLSEILREQTQDADASRLAQAMQCFPADGAALLQHLAAGLAD